MSRKEKFLTDTVIVENRIKNLKKLVRDMIKNSDEFVEDERIQKNIESIMTEAYNLKSFYSQRGKAKCH